MGNSFMKQTEEKKIAASIGCGIIGASWALKFAMGGYEVFAYSRSENSSQRAQKQVMDSLQSLQTNHLLDQSSTTEIFARIHFTTSLKEAVKNAVFIQESTREQSAVKEQLVQEMEKYAPKNAVIASSTSGMLITDIAKCAEYPARFVGGHPYNPPHLIPLVEVTKGEKTEDWAVERAKAFYTEIGSEPVVLQKEVPGFISNRLQMALYREVCSLVMQGVCTIEDADKAVTFGPGLRWGVMGPSLIFELGGGEGGISGLMRHLHHSISSKWADLSDLKELPAEWADIAQKGVEEELAHRTPDIGNTHETLETYRDRMLIELLRLHGKL